MDKECVISCFNSSILSFFCRAMKNDARTVASWDFEKIIPCHGVCRVCEMRFLSCLLTGQNRMSLRLMGRRLGRGFTSFISKTEDNQYF